HPLFDVNRQREEVRALARLHPALGRREHHRVARPDDDGAVCLLRELAALERDLAPADGLPDRGLALRGNRHLYVLHSAFAESGDLSQSPRERLAQITTLDG